MTDGAVIDGRDDLSRGDVERNILASAKYVVC